MFAKKTMRKKIVAGNWKMNLLAEEAGQLTADVKKLIGEEVRTSVLVILIPPFVHLPAVERRVREDDGAKIFTGAQNCSEHVAGAYTGEISAAMLQNMGAGYVLAGHSERRNYFHETNRQLAQKVNRILENNMQPVFCCGETKEERETGRHFSVISQQVEEGLFHLSAPEAGKIILAYEPVWAIGTGLTATASQAQEMHAFIRELLRQKYGILADEVSILYGGSCNEQNAAELFSQPDIDGGLIGGASLKARSFVNIVKCMS